MDFKLTIVLFLKISLFLGFVSTDSCQPIVNSLKSLGRVFTHNSICYVFLNHEKTWVDARSQCEAWGGDMVHIPDSGTMNFVKDVLDNELRWRNNGVWIGLHNRGDGGWRWTTGNPQTYSYWESGQPSKLFGLISFEDCACMRRKDGWRWHDYSCDHSLFTYKYICQFRMVTTTSTTTTTTTIKTTTVKMTTPTSPADPITTIKSVAPVYINPAKAVSADPVGHVIIRGIKPDSSMGTEVARKIGGSNKSDGISDSSKGIIIGLVLGVFIVIVISCMIFILFRRRRRMKREADDLVVQFENSSYIQGYTQGYRPVSQNEANVCEGSRPNSHVYMDTNEMNRLYEQVTKQVDHGVNNYDQLKPKTGACGSETKEGENFEDSDLKKMKVDLPDETDTPSQMNNANEYVDMGANKPKLTNLEVNARRVEKQNNLQQNGPIYNNETFHRERVPTPTEEELEVLDYEEHVPADRKTDPLYDIVD